MNKHLEKFITQYNEDAISSIVAMSIDEKASSIEHKINVINLESAVNDFISMMEGFADYHINIKDKKSSDAEIFEKTSNVLDDCIKDTKITCLNASSFVESYLESMSTIEKCIYEQTNLMQDAGVDLINIGYAYTCYETFAENISNKMYESMDTILTASGYKYQQAKKAIVESVYNKKESEKIIFI